MIPSKSKIIKKILHITHSNLPMPDEYGMNLAPNTASSMAVQMNELSRMPPPYKTKCIEDWSTTNLTVPKNTNYSFSVIVFSLRMEYLLTNCSFVVKFAIRVLWQIHVTAIGLNSSYLLFPQMLRRCLHLERDHVRSSL